MRLRRGIGAANAWRQLPSTSCVPGSLERLRLVALLAAVLLAAIVAAGAIDPSPTGTATVVATWCYLALLLGAGAMCALRARVDDADPRPWAVLSLGLLSWGATELYRMVDPAPSGLLTDLGFVGFYLSALVALVLLLQRSPRRWAAVPDALVSFLGLASLWSLFVLDHVLAHPSSPGQTSAATYAVLDLLGVGCAIALVARSGWRLGRADGLLLLGLGTIVVGDSFFLTATVHGGYERGSAFDALWPAGAVLVAVAAWMRPGDLVPDRLAGVRLSLAIAGGAVLSAVAILVYDHFSAVGTLTLTVAAATLLLSFAHAAAIHVERDRTAARLREEATRTVTALALAVDAKDAYTRDHSERVACYAVALGERLGMSARQIGRLEIAGRLHDVGKIALPDAILLKPGPLTDAEFDRVKLHPAEGERLARAAGLDDVALWIRHHHERWDGRGYPDRIAGAAIPVESRILAAADALDAMTSDRSYRGALSVAQAREEIAVSAGAQFDPEVAAALVDLLDGELHDEPKAPQPSPLPVATAVATV